MPLQSAAYEAKTSNALLNSVTVVEPGYHDAVTRLLLLEQ